MVDLPWLKNPNTVPGANGAPTPLTPSNVFNIEQFKSMINKSNGLAPTNRFVVLIRPPASLVGKIDTADAIRLLSFRCQSADLPGRALATADVRRQNPGVVQRIPYGQISGDTTFTFMCGNDMKEWKFFDKWFNSIVRIPLNNENGAGVANPNFLPYETEYFDEVKCEIEMRVYDQANREIYQCVMREAVPTFVSTIPLSWQNNDQYMVFQATFAFKDWIDDAQFRTSIVDAPIRVNKTLSKDTIVNPINTMISQISGLPTHVFDALSVINNTGLPLFNVLNNTL